MQNQFEKSLWHAFKFTAEGEASLFNQNSHVARGIIRVEACSQDRGHALITLVPSIHVVDPITTPTNATKEQFIKQAVMQSSAVVPPKPNSMTL